MAIFHVFHGKLYEKRSCESQHFHGKFHCFTLTKNFKIKRLFMTYYDAFMDYISWTIMHFIGKS